MSASDFPTGHAVRADGGLKDAFEMEWTYDTDESIPFPSDSLAIPATDDTVSPPLASVGIHPFFTHAKPPAAIVAGSCCSTHTSRPSQHVWKANDAPSVSTASTSTKPSTGSKRKAAVNLSPAPARRMVHKVVIDSDNEHDGNKTEPAVDEDPNNTDVSSQSLQAMADTDHEVRSFLPFVELLSLHHPGTPLQVQRRLHY